VSINSLNLSAKHYIKPDLAVNSKTIMNWSNIKYMTIESKSVMDHNKGLKEKTLMRLQKLTSGT